MYEQKLLTFNLKKLIKTCFDAESCDIAKYLGSFESLFCLLARRMFDWRQNGRKS
jgi:hypothetical protein